MLLHCDRWRESLAFSIGDEDTGHWQYKMSLHQRLLTVTLDLRGACLRMFLLNYTTDLTDYADFVLLGEIGIKKFLGA